ncbi:uncharacterized protein LOC116294194, partial [Actinia tenebrosa]|uniref:Uncharacterized protein LOC116294194 n=1 Tax=Actinia tenebrosa TaxID=6105 RepID=A0A6P8HMM1_ACTTE
MASIKYNDEELNYFRVCKVTTHIIPDGLRKVFKQEWNTRYQATHGQWQDTSKNGMDFYGMESPKNKKIKPRELSIMKNGNTNEWDCTCLFYGILYSNSIKPTLNVKKSVDELRKFRNEVFAHTKDGKLKEADFKTSIDKVITSFTDLKLDTTEIEEIKNETSFPTEELEDIKKQLEKKKKRNEEPRPFCVLPAKPSHETVSRLNEVDQINEEMERLRNAKNNEVTVVYLSGNPGCGKSEVARQIGERFFDEKSTEMNFVMTVNASTIDTLLQSYVEFADRVKCDKDF